MNKINAPEPRRPSIQKTRESKKEKSSKTEKLTAQQETQRKLDFIFDRVSVFCDFGEDIPNSLLEMV